MNAKMKMKMNAKMMKKMSGLKWWVWVVSTWWTWSDRTRCSTWKVEGPKKMKKKRPRCQRLEERRLKTW